MADDKGKIVDSVIPVETEEDSLGKANANESLNGPEVREEHFKQNILMDVNEFPNDENVEQEISVDQQVKDSEDLSKEELLQESQGNIVVDESAVYSPEQDDKDVQSTTSESDVQQVQFQNEEQADVVERVFAAVQEANEGNVGESAFQPIDVDQQAEEQNLFSSDDNTKDDNDVTDNLNNTPVASTPDQITDEDNVFTGSLNASDSDAGDSLTYNLVTNTGEGDITVNSDGSFTFIPGDEFQDLAAGESRDVAFTFQVQDQDGATDTQEVTITVTGENDAPISMSLSNAVVDEGANGAIIGDLTTNDIDASDSHSYTVDDARFEIVDDGSGVMQLKLKNGESLNFEAENSVSVTVTSIDSSGATLDQVYSVTVNDMNEFSVSAVTDTDAATNEVSESAAVGATVGVTAFASDADGSNSDVTYSLSSNPGNAFSIDADTGEVTVNDPSQLDFESSTSMQIEVTATSEDGSTSSETFNIAINDADEFDVSAVTDTDTNTNEVSESASVGATVGVTAFASDADGSNSDVSYSLSSNPGDAFSIDADTGEVTVNDPSQLDFENSSSMQIEVMATSEDGSTSSETFNIAINDADEFDVSAVTDSDSATNEVSESAVAGTSVGVTAFASDADGNNSDVTYSLSSNPNNAFSIDADTGEVTVANPAALNFENSSSMQIEVTATSEDGSTSSETFNIAINDVDEFDIGAVTDSDNATNVVNESANVGTSVGVTAFAEDLDGIK